ncbi:MAG TPA: hypothetical protein VNJ01_05820 [Bacteriovoracaceae bacterium]|nr:hypothetical protein [Bacteriovoracaceae bacterium]
MFKRSQLQAGFSIVQGLVLTGVVAASALVMVNMVRDQKLAGNTSESRGNIDQLHDLIFGILQYRDNCKATFLGTSPAFNINSANTYNLNTIAYASSVTGTGATAVVDASIMFKTFNSPLILGVENLYMKNSVSIEKMELDFDNVLFTGAPPTQQANPSLLKITYHRFSDDPNKPTKKGYGGKDIAKTIKIVFQKDRTTNNFLSCYAVETAEFDTSADENVTLAESFCENIGNPSAGGSSMMVWDHTRNICVFRETKCTPPSIFVGFEPTGLPACRLLSTWGFGTLLDQTPPTSSNCAPTSRTALQFEKVGTQVRIKCN